MNCWLTQNEIANMGVTPNKGGLIPRYILRQRVRYHTHSMNYVILATVLRGEKFVLTP